MNLNSGDQAKTIILEKFRTLDIAANANGRGLVWFTGSQDVIAQAIAPNQSFTMGPYIDDVYLRIECSEGSLTFDKNAPSQKPKKLSDILKTDLNGKTYQQNVATRGSISGNTASAALTDGTKTRLESRMKIFFGPQSCRDIRIVVTGFHATGSAAEVVNPNPITADFALELADASASVPFLFDGEQLLTVQPGGLYISDPLSLDFDAFATAWIRSGALVTSGQFIPISSMFAISGESMPYSTEATSQVNATGAMVNRTTGSTGPGGFIPAAILGTPIVNHVSVALYGDSLMAGTIGDGSDATTGARGAYARAVQGLFPWSNMARASETAAFNVGVNGFRRRQLIDFHSHVLINFDTNGIAGGATLAQCKASLTSIWTSAKRRGKKVYQSLIWPRTNAGNTAPVTGFAVGGIRDQLNAWIKTQVGNGILDGIIDANVVVESKTTPGLWANSAWTADGTHLNNAGCLAAAVPIRAAVSEWTI